LGKNIAPSLFVVKSGDDLIEWWERTTPEGSVAKMHDDDDDGDGHGKIDEDYYDDDDDDEDSNDYYDGNDDDDFEPDSEKDEL
jgi:hypothetical protein